jgi:hypothetical protein
MAELTPAGQRNREIALNYASKLIEVAAIHDLVEYPDDLDITAELIASAETIEAYLNGDSDGLL